MSELEQLKEEMILVGRALYNRGLIAGSTGNLSVRLKGGKFLVTPTRRNKIFLRKEDLLVVNKEGRVVEGEGKPTSEISMHLSIYERRPDISAIVHAHPPYTVALSMVDFRLDYPFLPEAIPLKIGIAPYSTPGTREVPESILSILPQCRVIILERHGAVALGKDLFEAFDLMDNLEHIAQICWTARCLGPITPLSLSQLRKVKVVWDEAEQIQD